VYIARSSTNVIGSGSGLTAPVTSNGGRFVVQAIAAPQNAQKVEASFRDELSTVLLTYVRGGDFTKAAK